MKVLIVDDNPERIRKIISTLVAPPVGLPRESVYERRTGQDAREFLRTEQVDLLLIDILLPRRAEDEPSVETSLQILTDLTETEELRKPRKVVGLTAYADAAAAASKSFVQQTWTIIETDEVGDGWLETIQMCVEYLKAHAEQRETPDYGVDIMLLTGLRDPEMLAVKRLPWAWAPDQPLDEMTFYSRGSVQSGSRNLSVVCAVADRMGMVSTAVLASKMMRRFKPRICVMPGICAGVKGRAAIGDVILAETCWDYQSGKFVVDDDRVSGFLIDPHFINAPTLIASRFDQLANDSHLMGEICGRWHARVATMPKLLRGPVASGSAVLADPSVTERIVSQQRKVRGIEMELYGLYSAAEQAWPKPVTFGMKSVCDLADSEKGDDYQEFAAFISAEVMSAFICRFGTDVVSAIDR